MAGSSGEVALNRSGFTPFKINFVWVVTTKVGFPFARALMMESMICLICPAMASRFAKPAVSFFGSHIGQYLEAIRSEGEPICVRQESLAER